MKYNAKQINETEWAVFKNGSNYWTSTVTTDREEAEQQAAYRSARWHLEQAIALVEKTSLQDAFELGRDADHLIDIVSDRNTDAMVEDGEIDEGYMNTDPRGWLA